MKESMIRRAAKSVIAITELVSKTEDDAIVNAFIGGAKWRENKAWVRVSDRLPEIDREVIVLQSNNKVCFAHRPNPNGWDGRNIVTGEVTHHDVKTYDKGGWNIPDVKYWMDLKLPWEK